MPQAQTWFRLSRKLAEGGMGAVYLGEHVKTGQTVAVKLLKPEPKTQELEVEWLLAEVQATARLHHTNVIGILDHGTLPQPHDGFAAGSPYFAMEFVEGGSVAEHPPQDGLELA
ncbi:MAG: protein kinase [bacterium]